MLLYKPMRLGEPLTIHPATAWGNIPTILLDLIERTKIKTNICLEFGVEYGYSTSALANYFTKVIGVDTFDGDVHSGIKQNHFDYTRDRLSTYPNIELVQSSYQDFILNNTNYYDLIHIDIVHTYQDTFDCGEWSVHHADCVIFHDTESFHDVKSAVTDLASKYNLYFYNFVESCGLGILTKRMTNE